MLYKETPFTGYCIALASGIICGSYMHSVIYCNAGLIILSVFLIAYILLYKNIRSSISFGLILHCCIFLLACSLSVIQSNKLDYLPPLPHEFVLKTEEYPSPTARSIRVHTRIIKSGGADYGKNNKMVLYTDSSFVPLSLKPGTVISLVSVPVEITDFDSTDNFDYRSFMNHRGFRYCTFCYDSIAVIDERPTIKHLGLRLRKYLFNRLQNNLTDEKSLAIVSAMSLGYRDLIDDNIKEQFRKSGIIHIMAVSGLHVGIISMIIISLLKITRIRSGTVKLVISLLLIWSYALMTGLSPSVTRASVMFSFLNTGYLINRPVNPVNSVMASAFLIMLINPAMLYEASFLLSYSAVIFIVANYRQFVSMINLRGRILSYVWKMITISLLAQVGTIPFVALFFGEIPLFSILSNLFAIPLATIILSSGFALILFSSVPLIAGLLSDIIEYSVNTLTDAAVLIASTDCSVITTGDISAERAVILFFFLLFLTLFLLDREKSNPHIPLAIMILYFIIP